MYLTWKPISDSSTPIAIARPPDAPPEAESQIAFITEDGGEDGRYDDDSGSDMGDASDYVMATSHSRRGGGRHFPSDSRGVKLEVPRGWQFTPLPAMTDDEKPDDDREPNHPSTSKRPTFSTHTPSGGLSASKFDKGPTTKREVILVTGQSGGGKSYWVRMYTRNYVRMYPDNPVYLISSLKEDKTLDAVDEIQRIDIDKLVANPPKDVYTWKNALVIIDDVEGLEDTKKAAVQRVQDMIASEGRHSGTSLVRAAHNCTDHKRTRLLLQETHGFVIFPNHGATSQYIYLLNKYAGFKPKLIQSILAQPTRWIYIHFAAPRYVLTSNSVSILNPHIDPPR